MVYAGVFVNTKCANKIALVKLLKQCCFVFCWVFLLFFLCVWGGGIFVVVVVVVVVAAAAVAFLSSSNKF